MPASTLEDQVALRVALVTSIFPPDIGGPATHSADLARELRRRGHTVQVVTLGHAASDEDSLTVGGDSLTVRIPREGGWALRHLRVLRWLVDNRTRYDVIYATAMLPTAIAAGRLSRRPVAAKVVGDAAWERASRLGLTDQGFVTFQRSPAGSLRVLMMRVLRNEALRRASAVVAPSAYLAGVADDWLGGRGLVNVIPNGVTVGRVPPHHRSPDDLALRLVSVGRLVAHKRLPIVLEALAVTPGASLDVVGEGPEEGRLRAQARALGIDPRVRFLGRLPHAEVLEVLATSDALVMATGYEGLPHVAIEALACGTPVVAPAIGGLDEVVEDGVTGILYELPELGGPAPLAAALARLRDDRGLRVALSEQAQDHSRNWTFDVCCTRVESLLRTLAHQSSLAHRGRSEAEAAQKPRVVFLGKGAFGSPVSGELAGKLDILSKHLDPVLIGAGSPPAAPARVRALAFPRLRPRALGGALFYALGPVAALAESGMRPSSAIVCQSPYEAASALALARLLPRARRPQVVVEVHGDWRTAARLYGGWLRRPLAPLADRVAAWAVRRAGAVRAIGDFTEGLVRDLGREGEVERFVAYGDYTPLLAEPPAPVPGRPRVAFVGVLEDYKGVDILLRAWVAVVQALPDARLTIAGEGSRARSLARMATALGIDGSVDFVGRLPAPEVRSLLDASSLLVLPSRSEGLGRVIVEAHARGRPVVAAKVGGICELVECGRTGLLFPPEDHAALASALVDLLRAPECQEAMGAEGRRRIERRDPGTEFEAGIARLARRLSALRA